MSQELMPLEKRVVHVRFEGQSQDIAFGVLDIGDLSNDQDMKSALALHFNTPVPKFASYMIERHVNGNVTVRPEAVFG